MMLSMKDMPPSGVLQKKPEERSARKRGVSALRESTRYLKSTFRRVCGARAGGVRGGSEGRAGGVDDGCGRADAGSACSAGASPGRVSSTARGCSAVWLRAGHADGARFSGRTRPADPFDYRSLATYNPRRGAAGVAQELVWGLHTHRSSSATAFQRPTTTIVCRVESSVDTMFVLEELGC